VSTVGRPSVKWVREVEATTEPRLRGNGARQHRIWQPVFTQLCKRPGCYARVATENDANTAAYRVRTLRKYVERHRPDAINYWQIHHKGCEVFIRYMPPSMAKRRRGDWSDSISEQSVG
jgi:hypothetical protein